jgi:hypothetical protein
MNLSEQTVGILKNFSHINNGLYFQQGKSIKTVAPSKAILASANITEEIPTDFGIYDLSKFLGAISLFSKPLIGFESQHLELSEDNKKCRYTYCDPSLVVRPPEGKTVQLPTEDVCFDLSQRVFDEIIKGSSVLQVPDVAVRGDRNTIKISTLDSKNPSDEMTFDVGKTDKDFTFYFKVENFSKLMSKDYTVNLSSKGLSRFDSTDDVLQYYIALEPNSEYNG